jgi:3',5'-nucleoside bisphosphate phosphatase
LIDLHTHTTASDGSFEPAQLIAAAVEAKLDALSITDHDTFAGYEEARPHAAKAGLELICGIELSTKLPQPGRPRGRSIHLLGYFPKGEPAGEFIDWIRELGESRKDRNRRLAKRLQELNVDVSIEEVEARGRNMAGRPHFAQILVEKGYVATLQEAFDKYLDQNAEAFVEREEPMLGEGIRRIANSGGVASLAHPIRLGKRRPGEEEDAIRQMAKMGLPAIEAYHSDHAERDVERYQLIARRYELAVTGGSDFHGANKPGILVGTGKDGNVAVPNSVLDRLKQLAKG